MKRINVVFYIWAHGFWRSKYKTEHKIFCALCHDTGKLVTQNYEQFTDMFSHCS